MAKLLGYDFTQDPEKFDILIVYGVFALNEKSQASKCPLKSSRMI